MKVYPTTGIIINYASHEVPKFVISLEDMEESIVLGYIHLKTTATSGMKILFETFEKLLTSLIIRNYGINGH